MKILFLFHSNLNCNSGNHIISLANALVDLGLDCLIGVPNKSDTSSSTNNNKIKILHREALFECIEKENPDLIHLWTPREANRKYLDKLRTILTCPYIVHLEDNEFHLTKVAYGMNEETFKKVLSGALNINIPDHLSDPVRARAVLNCSSGVTALINELMEFKPTKIPGLVFWPAYDESLPWGIPCDTALREKFGIGIKDYAITYTGNMHSANMAEIRSLYLAVALLNRRGYRLRLIRTGQNFVPLTDIGENLLKANSIELGFRPREELPLLLSIADILVQPGKVDKFNIYRFPSKLPEFLASGRPVILPNCNIGSYLDDGENALVLKNGDASEIAEAIKSLLIDPDKRKKVGSNGASFARKKLRWRVAAEKLSDFYTTILEDL